jgi:hypothetical protein
MQGMTGFSYYTSKEMRDNRILSFLLGMILTSILFIVFKGVI